MQNLCIKSLCYKVSKWAVKVFSWNSIWPAYCIRSSVDLNCCVRCMDIKSSINAHLPTCSFPNTHGLLVYVYRTEERLQSCGFANALLLTGEFLLSGVQKLELFLYWDQDRHPPLQSMQEAKVNPPVHDFLTAVSEHHPYAVAIQCNVKARCHSWQNL